jgi:hypothetical protein
MKKRPVNKDKGSLHLADVKGWLSSDDKFFEIIDRVIADRAMHKPRVLRKG